MPDFVQAERVGPLDRILRLVYDAGGPFHDPMLRLVLRLVDGLSEPEARQRLLDRLPMTALEEIASHRPVRAIDVSFGTGGELLGLARSLPPGSQLFGVDLSRTMARLGARNLARDGVTAQLCLGDAHYLPYADESFDLLVHVGGINAFSDKRRGLAEMVRVVRPGAMLLLVDEQLESRRTVPLWQKAIFRASTWWDRVQTAPVELLPENVEDVRVEQLLTFYYLLTFRKTG
jgi:ubiquinone/menaquinone biosynthesis C-methylase UbiE